MKQMGLPKGTQMKIIIAVGLMVAFLQSHALADIYRLNIANKMVTVAGKTVEKIAINDSIPGPTLRFTEGEEVTIVVTNSLNEDTSLHWHGLLLDPEMDGVPGLSNFAGIKPGDTFTYKFKIRQTGTYWYHSHSGGQEQDGVYGALVIMPKETNLVRSDRDYMSDRDYVIVLSDISPETSDDIIKNLKLSPEYYQYARRTVGDFFDDVKRLGWRQAWDKAKAWGKMRMMPTDLSDVANYVFLMNGKTPDENWTEIFKPGQRVRLRFINASAMTIYDVRIPGLKLDVISADGQNIEPVTKDEFRFGVAETYDVIVTPKEDKAYSIVAEPIDRTGFAFGTLAPRDGMKGPAPKQRARALLTMKDMGMNHPMNNMTMGENNSMSMDDSQMNMDQGQMNMDQGQMGMDHSQMSMDHGQMNMGESPMRAAMQSGWAQAGTPAGKQALSYADLRFHGIQKDVRQAERTIEVGLGGNMERYIWTMNGKKYSEASPIHLRYGERVRLRFTNHTMMAHPMHLHGMFVQLENGQPAEKLPNKHTVTVAPGASYSVLLTADEAGEWAFHCHLLFHMMSGMMNKVVVAKLDAKAIPTQTMSDMPSMDSPQMQQGYQHRGH
jgi:CopA family copper-resistance protein